MMHDILKLYLLLVLFLATYFPFYLLVNGLIRNGKLHPPTNIEDLGTRFEGSDNALH